MVEILDNSIGHCEEIPSFEVESRINSFYPFLYNQIFFNLALRLKHINLCIFYITLFSLFCSGDGSYFIFLLIYPPW